MIKGMTGFGHCDMSTGHIRILLEIKSLNHRYFDLSFYMPIGFSSLEDKVRKIVQKEIQRGRVTISVKILDRPHQEVSLNRDVVRAHLKHARQLRKEFKLEDDLALSHILQLPGVFEVKETPVQAPEIWPGLEKCLSRALKELKVMRRREGRSLKTDINDKLRRMKTQARKIKMRAQAILKSRRKDMTPEEFKSFQRSNDINEELARLTHYIAEMKLLLTSDMSVGKRIDFIAQEMQRETNTIGSKLQDTVVSNGVIALKSKVEKIREQAQNIE